MSMLEQARLALQKNDPDLYAYIAAFEAVKVLNSAKEVAQNGPVAGRLLAMASNYERRVNVLTMKT